MFHQISEYVWQFEDLEEYLQRLLYLLKSFGMNHVLRVAFSKPEEPLQIVKMMVPTLEHFTKKNKRVGKRLAQKLAEL